MRRRTFSRECALKILYKMDLIQDSLDSCIDDFWQDQDKIEVSVKEFAELLVRGVYKNLKFIDEKVSLYATNWQLKRMAIVDRNILRLGSFEIIFLKDVPVKVSINEAVELAKKYSDQESGKFVNGILDKIKQERKFGD